MGPPELSGGTVLPLLQPDWPAPAGVRAVCTLRGGGVSTGAYASLNLATHVGDDPLAVAQNRRRLREALALPGEPLWLEQRHGIEVIDADAWSPTGALPPADGAVTRSVGRVLGVLVADCLPVLLARGDGSGVAVAHAGWRGLAAGVLEAAVGRLGSENSTLLAWLGPAIGPDHFEVGEEVREAFLAHTARAGEAFRRNERGRWWCDLRALALQRLAALGVHAVYGRPRCSFRESESFYSYRRDRTTGRMAALIWRGR